uniref:F-box domain-containing protein n=1 Tax=Mycena chlorophos TaxID=658473 RepID=A0ABQ0LX36_MYCCL|nr:predicted protein [Mycena chlorophos]
MQWCCSKEQQTARRVKLLACLVRLAHYCEQQHAPKAASALQPPTDPDDTHPPTPSLRSLPTLRPRLPRIQQPSIREERREDRPDSAGRGVWPGSVAGAGTTDMGERKQEVGAVTLLLFPSMTSADATPAERAETRARLSALRDEIEKTREKLAALEEESEILENRLDAYCYPILTLPVEITSEIFRHYIPPYPSCPPLLGMGSPTTLCHVCSLWRRIALSMPLLWRAIRLFSPFDAIFGDDGASDKSSASEDACSLDLAVAQVAEATRWLQRSSTQRLSITIGELFPSADVRASAFDVLQNHRPRWEYVCFRLRADFKELDYIDGDMPSLAHLDLEEVVVELGNAYGDITKKQFRLPVIRTALLRFTRFVDARLPDCLPWTRLQTLMLENLNIDMAHHVLWACPNLVKCCFHLTGPSWPTPAPLDPKLPNCLVHLEMLVLDADSELTLNLTFLERLRLPKLRKFCISEPLLRPTPLVLLDTLLHGFGCGPLQTLQMVNMSGVPPDEYRLELASATRAQQLIFLDVGEDTFTLDPDIWGYWRLSDL